LLLFLFLCTGEGFCQIKPGYIESKIKLDGLINEPEWKTAEPVTDFTQRELSEGDPPTEKTEVRILFDDDNLYVGVICYDSEPDRIVHKELKWDGDLADSDDFFAVVLDTYHDMRMGFAFGVNPNGAQVDGTFRSGQDVNTQWDAIWNVSSKITDYGWSCEIMIPFKSLRFPTSEKQTWGINFMRKIRRKNEEVLWRGWRRNAGIDLLSQAGTLEITRPVRRSRQIDVKPYILAGAEKELNKNTDDVFRYGLDVKYGITSNMTLDLTTKTDFAQIESDREVINLTRFDIHYPEKRDFFLEGSDTFDFTQGGTRLFYSRRIGITPDRQEQPILGGAKLTQKAGSYRLGMLTMQTEDKHGYPGANYSAFRVKKDIFEQSYVGLIATSVINNDKHDNQVYGMDWGYRTDKFFSDKNLDIQGYLTASVDDGSQRDNMAGRLFINYPNDLVSSFILYHTLDENFKPGLGFASRVGIQNYIWYTTISPRPNIPFIKKLIFKPFNFYYNADMGGRIITRRVQIQPIGFISNSDDEFSFNYRNEFDYVEKDYAIQNTIDIKQGGYEWWYYDMNLSSSRRRPVRLHASTRWGDYYKGSRTSYSGSITVKMSEHYALSADTGYNDISIGDQSLVTRDYGGRLSIDFSTKLSTSTFIQYNNQTKKVNANFRLRYIPKIGSDLYLVYNHLLDEDDDFRTLQNAAMLKMDYIYRF
jgi:hypothetical protein